MATVPAIATISVGQKVTAAYLNSLRDAIAYLTGTPLCVVTSSVTQSIATATLVPATFDTEAVDSDAMHSTTTNISRLVCVTAGWFDAEGTAGLAANATGSRFIEFMLNGTTEIARVEIGANASAGRGTSLVTATKVFLNVGDYLELVVFQNSGGALSTAIGPTAARFALEWVHT